MNKNFYEETRGSFYHIAQAYIELTKSGHSVNYDLYDMIEYISVTFGISVTIYRNSEEEPSIKNPTYGFIITTNGINGNPLAYKNADWYYTEYNASSHALAILIHYLDDERNNKIPSQRRGGVQ